MSAFSPEAGRVPQFAMHKSAGDYFQCKITAYCTIYEPGCGLQTEEKKAYGVTIFVTQNGSSVIPLTFVHYYASGNLLHKTMEILNPESVTRSGSNAYQ
jgi:hypothetical protein